MKSINLAIIGQTGVGKSSLINYLFDEKELAETGSGKPVTKSGFYKYKKFVSEREYTVFDSFGLEKGKTKQWLQNFEDFIGPLQNSKDVEDWLHSCIYCFSGASSRYQDFEIKILKKLINKKLKPVVVVTKADSKDSIILAKEIKNKTGIDPILVTSIHKEYFKGKVKPRGREELIEKLVENASESFLERLKFMLKSIETEKLKKIYCQNFDFVKSYLLMEKTFLDTIPKKKLDFILNTFKRLVEKDTQLTQHILNDTSQKATLFYKKQIKFSKLNNSNIQDFDPSDFDDYKWNLNDGLLMILALPLTLTALFTYFLGPKTDAENFLKGLKSSLLKNFNNNRELQIYLEKNLSTTLEPLNEIDKIDDYEKKSDVLGQLQGIMKELEEIENKIYDDALKVKDAPELIKVVSKLIGKLKYISNKMSDTSKKYKDEDNELQVRLSNDLLETALKVKQKLESLTDIDSDYHEGFGF